MTNIPVELRELLERAASLITEMSGGIRSADEYGDFSAECDDAEEFASELRALLSEQPQAGAGQEPDTARETRRRDAEEAVKLQRILMERYSHLRPVNGWGLFDWAAAVLADRHDQGDEVRRLREALSLARDYVYLELEERKSGMAGYPHKWRQEEADLAAIDAALTHSPKGEEE